MWSSFNSPTFSMRAVLLSGFDADGSAGQASAPFTAAVTPTPGLFQAKFQIPSFASFSTAIWFQLQDLDGLLTPSNDLLIDLIGMNTGQQFTAYSPRSLFENNVPATSTQPDFFDLTPAFTGSDAAQATSPTGPTVVTTTQGGGSAPGQGSRILLS